MSVCALQSAADASSRAAVAASAAAAAVAVTKAAAARAATKAAYATRAATGKRRAAASTNGAAPRSKPSGNGASSGPGRAGGVNRGASSEAVTAEDLEGVSDIEQQLLSGECRHGIGACQRENCCMPCQKMNKGEKPCLTCPQRMIRMSFPLLERMNCFVHQRNQGQHLLRVHGCLCGTCWAWLGTGCCVNDAAVSKFSH